MSAAALGWASHTITDGVRADGSAPEYEVLVRRVQRTTAMGAQGTVVPVAGLHYGYLVEITHPTGYVTRYGHNSRNLVREGQTVQKGDAIAVIGSTGRSTGTHVHFEVERDGNRLNPMRYLSAP